MSAAVPNIGPTGILTAVSIVAPHVKALFQGIDVTVFAYGVTGTGKTHTMRGGLRLEDRGVIPRLLSNVFRRAKKIDRDSKGATTANVHLSYYEIYNDKVFDLLEAPDKRLPAGLPLREKGNKTFIVGLSERLCQDLKDFEKMYVEANNNRVTATTKLNAHSSRSHAILRVKLTQTTGDMVKESIASAIDLAGSEDNRRTDNGKERLVESAAINKSLFVLSQCIDAISRGDKRIPYRESKMTRILSIGQNNGITVMILNLAPLRSYHLDTLSSLNVSSRAKRIEVREIENEVVFKTQPPRAVIAAAPSISRQPLRPITSTHNSLAGALSSRETKRDKPGRPAKAFQVYSDKPRKPVARSLPAPNTTVRRTVPRRPSDPEQSQSRTKITRPVPSSRSMPGITTDDIEAIIEKKVAEILASRAAEQAQVQQKERASPTARDPETVKPQSMQVSEEVQKRLDALEKKVEASAKTGDERSPGLRLLMQARHAKEMGDDETTLKCYEAALPYFPGQARLNKKIEKLKAKMAAKHAAHNIEIGIDAGDGMDAADELEVQELERLSPAKVRPQSRSPRKKRKRKAMKQPEEEEQSEYQGDEADYEAEEVSFVRKKRCKNRGNGNREQKRSKCLADDAETKQQDETGSAAPSNRDARAGKLLDILNSRDENRIRSLHGLGAKKARDVLEYMTQLGDGQSIKSLEQLRSVPGLGERIIERALEGLAL